MKKNKNKIITILYCLLFSILCITFCSKNSPLYPMNDWVDANAFFTMGRSWLHGLIPYRDLFEQKGPLLYLIYMLGAIISYKNFIGIYIIEIIFYSVYAYIIGKISDLYLKKNFKYIVIPIILTLTSSSFAFVHGGSAEELMLPFLVGILYIFLKYLKNKEISRKELFIMGLLTGCLAMTKYTLIGISGAIMIVIFIDMLIKKEYKSLFKNILVFLLGMLIPILVFLIYFMFTHTLTEFLDEYILINIKYYGEKYTLLARFNLIFEIIKGILKQYIILFILLVIINILLLTTKVIFKITKEKLSYLFVMLLSFLGIYWGTKNFPYYFLSLYPFIILPIIYILKLIESKIKFDKKRIILIIVLISLISIYNISNYQYSYFRNVKDKNLVQTKFAKIINKKKNATLLNYLFLDGGFYLKSGIDPTVFAFEGQNIDCRLYSGVCDKQNAAIMDGKVDFVVMRTINGKDEVPDFVFDKYKIVKEENQEFEHINFKYILFEKKDGEKDG